MNVRRMPGNVVARAVAVKVLVSNVRQMSELEDSPPSGIIALRAEYKPLRIHRATLAASGLSDAELLNPSVCVHRGELRVVVRALAHAKTYNFLGRVTDDWELTQAREMKNLTGQQNPFGYEDCRLFDLDGELHASATVLSKYATLVVLDIDDRGDFVGAHAQWSERHEKNWMPIAVGRSLRFVYSVEPTSLVVSYNRDTCNVYPSVSNFTSTKHYLRGGSQLEPYGDGFIALVHQVHRSPTMYLHRFVRFDRDLQVVKMSEPFYFLKKGIEFCAGLVRWRDRWVVSFGVADKEAHLGLVDDDVVRGLIA